MLNKEYDLYLLAKSKGFEAYVFFAAIELDFFENLKKYSGNLSLIAERLNCEEQFLRLLLDVLLRLGLVRSEKNNKFKNNLEYESYLTDGDLSIKNELLYFKRESEALYNLANLAKGNYQLSSRAADMSKVYDFYIKGVLESNQIIVDETINLISFDLIDAALDIGGGHGEYSKALLKKNKKTKVSLLDINKAKSLEGEPRIDFIQGNAENFFIDKQFDLIMINDLLHYFSLKGKKQVLENACKHLKKNGQLLVSKFTHDNRCENQFSTNFSLYKYLLNDKAYLAYDEEIELLIDQFNFSSVEKTYLGDEKTIYLLVK